MSQVVDVTCTFGQREGLKHERELMNSQDGTQIKKTLTANQCASH